MSKKPKQPKLTSAEQSNIVQATIDAINNKCGEGKIVRMDYTASTSLSAPYLISTGSIALDIAIGTMRREADGTWSRGIPPGCMVEIHGDEMSGKTTVMTLTAVQAQKLMKARKMNLKVAIIDVEHTFDPERAKHLGLDLSSAYFSQPNSGEEALQLTDQLVRSGQFVFIGFDSMAAAIPQAELDGEIGDKSVGLQARMFSQALRKINGGLGEKHSPTLLMFTNQLRMFIDPTGYQQPRPATAGGRAMKFYSSMRIKLRQGKKIEAVDKHGVPAIVGNDHHAQIVKNKKAPPFREAEFPIYFSVGIDRRVELATLGIEYGVIQTNGSWFSYEGNKWQGKANVIGAIYEDKTLHQPLLDAIMARAMSSRGMNPDGTYIVEPPPHDEGESADSPDEPGDEEGQVA